MATTDFLLRPAVQSLRSQPAAHERASSAGGTPTAPRQNFFIRLYATTTCQSGESTAAGSATSGCCQSGVEAAQGQFSSVFAQRLAKVLNTEAKDKS